MIRFFLLTLLSFNCYALTKKSHSPTKINLNGIRNGIVTKNLINKDGENKNLSYLKNLDKSVIYYTNSMGEHFHSKSDLLIKFNKSSRPYLAMIEKSYHLKLIEQLIIGDYRFRNTGKSNTVDIINRIVKKEKANLVRIYPDKTLNYIKR
jgi:hypothetical protein